jgi:hypothetical protein
LVVFCCPDLSYAAFSSRISFLIFSWRSSVLKGDAEQFLFRLPPNHEITIHTCVLAT